MRIISIYICFVFNILCCNAAFSQEITQETKPNIKYKQHELQLGLSMRYMDAQVSPLILVGVIGIMPNFTAGQHFTYNYHLKNKRLSFGVDFAMANFKNEDDLLCFFCTNQPVDYQRHRFLSFKLDGYWLLLKNTKLYSGFGLGGNFITVDRRVNGKTVKKFKDSRFDRTLTVFGVKSEGVMGVYLEVGFPYILKSGVSVRL